MAKIIRKPDFAGGGITAEEKSRMDAHTQLWIARAMRTASIEPQMIVPALEGLYAAANLERARIVIVPSPLAMAIAGCFSAAIWQQRGRATDAATVAATDAATDDATSAATRAATRAATDAATDAATRDATADATRAAPSYAWVSALAREFSHGDANLYRVMIGSLQSWWRMYQGGNMWAAWDCYLTAARDILGLKLPAHEKYTHWEQASIHGGYRIMHPKFCMVCDFPEVLKVDSRNRPHCEDGPSHRWRDGWSLYHWHGLRVPQWLIEKPELITVEAIDKEPNAEIRSVMCERYGMSRYVRETGAEKLDESPELGVTLLRKRVGNENILFVHMRNSTVEPDGTVREFISRLHSELKPIPPADLVGAKRDQWYADHKPQKLTARNAIASTFGLYGEQYAPEHQA